MARGISTQNLGRPNAASDRVKLTNHGHTFSWGSTSAMRILVVDDEKIKRVTLADDLSGQGHEVVTAADGQQALELLDRELFDVVVTDIKMPKIDGLELL